VEFIDLKTQYANLQPRIQHRLESVLGHGKYILGPEVQELEQQLADFAGVDHCIGVANGTDALQLALMALGVGEGDAVFVPSFTFFASAEVISLVGATPVFVDVEAETYTISIASLKAAIEDTKVKSQLIPRAIIAVDLFGLPADYTQLEQLAKTEGLHLVEDAAQSFGAGIGERKAGCFGDIATTSFFPAKPLGCYGDGGAVFTSDNNLAELVRSLRVHGKGVDKYDNVRIGLNSRLDTMQAAILLEKLAVYPEEIVQRESVAAAYNQQLANNYELTEVRSGFSSVWAQFTIRSKSRTRQEIQDRLQAEGIPSAVYYSRGVHQQTAYRDLCPVALPVTEKIQAEVFSLPMSPYLSESDQSRVIDVLNGI